MPHWVLRYSSACPGYEDPNGGHSRRLRGSPNSAARSFSLPHYPPLANGARQGEVGLYLRSRSVSTKCWCKDADLVAYGGGPRRNPEKRMARRHSRYGSYEASHSDDAPPVALEPCWLCGRPTGKTIVLHHPVPKSRGGRDVVPMHPICQQTLTANFTNSELERHGMDVEGLLANPAIRKFVDWVAKKDPDFTATATKKQR